MARDRSTVKRMERLRETRRAARAGDLGGLFAWMEPKLTLEEVGCLLGISDHTAMKVEQSATRKLRALLSALGLRTPEEFASASPRKIHEALPPAEQDDYYTPARGWFPLEVAKSLNDGTESLAEMAAAYSMLRLNTSNHFRVPLLVRSRQDEAYELFGRVESLTRVGATTLFYSPTLTFHIGKLKPRKPALRGVAIVESEFGTDAAGEFEVPVLQVVMVSLAGKE